MFHCLRVILGLTLEFWWNLGIPKLHFRISLNTAIINVWMVKFVYIFCSRAHARWIIMGLIPCQYLYKVDCAAPTLTHSMAIIFLLLLKVRIPLTVLKLQDQRSQSELWYISLSVQRLHQYIISVSIQVFLSQYHPPNSCWQLTLRNIPMYSLDGGSLLDVYNKDLDGDRYDVLVKTLDWQGNIP